MHAQDGFDKKIDITNKEKLYVKLRFARGTSLQAAVNARITSPVQYLELGYKLLYVYYLIHAGL